MTSVLSNSVQFQFFVTRVITLQSVNLDRRAIMEHTRLLSAVVLLGLLLLGSAPPSQGARILGILPSVGRSHYIIGAGLMKALLDAGHEVTIVSPYPMKDAPAHPNPILVGN